MPAPQPEHTIDLTRGANPDALRAQYDAAWQLSLSSGGPPPNRDSFLVGTGADRESLLSVLKTVDETYSRLREMVLSGAMTLTIAPGTVRAGDDGSPKLDDSAFAVTMDSKPAADGEAAPEDGKPTPENRLLGAGITVGNYELLGVIAHGGMGVVYKARHNRLDRHAAIKMILAGAHASADHFARFQAESQVVAKLQHPNIVQLYEVGEHDNLPFIALEFVEGGSLAHKAGGQPQPPREAASVVELLARGMDYAHQKGVVHRDLKPANVLLTTGGVPKITDFGLAKQLESDSGQTRSGTLMGTPSYMAPEQAAGWIHAIGPHTDVYALGAILYELLTGVPPFAAGTALETVVAVLKNDPVPPTRLQPDVPKDLETICLKCLEKEPPKRYDTAAELAEDLRRFLAQEPIRARPIGRVERLWRWCRRHPGIAALSAAVLLLLTTVAVGSTAAAFRIQAEKRTAEENATAAIEAQGRAEAALTEAERQKQLAVQSATEAREAQAATAQALKKEEVARTEAERQEGIAKKNAAAAENARKRADALATVAATQRELALDALGGLTTTVQQQLDTVPGTQKVKQELLKLALAKLRQVSGNAEQAAVADIRMAEGYRRLGDLAQQLGDLPLARQNYEQVERIVRQQMEVNQGDLTWKRSLAVAQVKLGDLSTAVGDKVRATEYYELARKHRIELAVLDPNSIPAKVDLAQVYDKLGDVSPPGPAIAFYKESLQLREEILAERGDADSRRDVRVSQYKLADGYLRGGDAAAALPHAKKAVELGDELLKQYKNVIVVIHGAALAHAKLGDVYRILKRPDDERKEYEAAVKTLEPLAKADLKNLVLQVTHAVFLAHAGRHADATRLAGQIREQAPKNAFLLYNSACAYSLALETVTGGKTPSDLTPDEQKLFTTYGDAAIDCLKDALAAGFADPDHIKTDPELAAVRALPGFIEVAKKLPVTDRP